MWSRSLCPECSGPLSAGPTGQPRTRLALHLQAISLCSAVDPSQLPPFPDVTPARVSQRRSVRCQTGSSDESVERKLPQSAAAMIARLAMPPN
ncbi:hypothetical protein NDU88_004830 [Pleurodeles waltl]|uniref:Uncharacterized protein n=1 Tax=Pleurodeles waltl TaxID=8319 RepID=A0AAV7M869_PLEWA|nr:hypothetical protein NDU88_004830 [Pleurodeles waltl]